MFAVFCSRLRRNRYGGESGMMHLFVGMLLGMIIGLAIGGLSVAVKYSDYEIKRLNRELKDSDRSRI